MNSLKVVLVTPEGKLFDGEANHVNVPGTIGSFGIYYNHAPIISTLQKGAIKIHTKNEEKIFHVENGVVEVLKNQISILVEGVLNA
jgi:F-type H+-transporting ATPase subunit epsilon